MGHRGVPAHPADLHAGLQELRQRRGQQEQHSGLAFVCDLSDCATCWLAKFASQKRQPRPRSSSTRCAAPATLRPDLARSCVSFGADHTPLPGSESPGQARRLCKFRYGFRDRRSTFARSGADFVQVPVLLPIKRQVLVLADRRQDLEVDG